MNKVLRATLVSAVVITTVIGIASFVLSFAALWDLATMAGVPRSLSWLWPVIVDGTILQATISVIALAQFEDQRSGRRFFWGVLITAALVSIGANAMHAFISDAGTLHPALSAAIATVAPVSLLAATHGLGILVRIPAELPKTIDIADEDPAPEEVAIAVPRVEPVTPGAELPTSKLPTPDIPAPAPMVRTEPVRTEPVRTEPVRTEPIRTEPVGTEPGRTEQRPPEASVTSVRTVEPLDEVDRWILDEERVDDLYPVDAP
ncbi:DUF2637 domain-containing protein [Rhodococcus sp. SBT000017]|uniref:DUF2637 domain-containing protein n=1 Tax=Rhodococcus sp. SBT000017 TaxID=1803385 RepID=UPI000EF8A7F5|nr:DUF2637 domain-containing protein [Rhodococcus sp. SBT000017]RMB78444.1 DUF2637 domain-containing protein [Rhodococcus sp. SBT000017]